MLVLMVVWVHGLHNLASMQGSAVYGMMALCGRGPNDSQEPPGMVINDYTLGYYSALAVQATLLRRA